MANTGHPLDSCSCSIVLYEASVIHQFTLYVSLPASNRHKSCPILKINIRKSCLGIRSLRRPVVNGAYVIHWSQASTNANNWCRSAYDRCGRPSPFRPAVWTAVVPSRTRRDRPRRLAPLSACGGHRGTWHASRSSSGTWGRTVAYSGPYPATDF